MIVMCTSNCAQSLFTDKSLSTSYTTLTPHSISISDLPSPYIVQRKTFKGEKVCKFRGFVAIHESFRVFSAKIWQHGILWGHN